MALFTKPELKRKAKTLKNIEGFYKNAASLLEEETRRASQNNTFDIFLAHDYSEPEEIRALKMIIEDMGYSVLAEWTAESYLHRAKITQKAAEHFRSQTLNCKCLFYVKFTKTQSSKWMQWKLGYFDGQKNRVAILPISETDFASDEYKPQDYLGIYPYVAKGCPENSTTETLWIHETAKKYVVFDWWLKGIDPVDPFTRDRLTS